MITMGSENVTSRTVWEFDCRPPWANGLSCSETIFSHGTMKRSLSSEAASRAWKVSRLLK